MHAEERDNGTTVTWQRTDAFPSCPDRRPEDFHILRNQFSGQCLEVDITNGRVVEGARVRQMTCGFGFAHQQWQTIDNMFGHALRNNGTGKCLDVDEGTGLTLQRACDNSPHQAWAFEANGNVRHRDTNRCLDLDPHDGLNTPGIYVRHTACAATSTQRWVFAEPPPRLPLPIFP